jgi:hypothetical protein
VRVTAVRATRAGASAATWGSTATNASGEYSLGGLPPGPYYVRAFIPYQALSSGEMPLRGVFHPDAHDEADAATVTLAAGEDRIGIDVRLQEARPAHVSGTVLNMPPDAAPALYLFPDGLGPSVVTPDADGRFTFTGVPPGSYAIETGLIDAPPQFFIPDEKSPLTPATEQVSAKVVVRGQYSPTLVRMTPPAIGSWGRAEVRTDGYDVEGLVIDLRKTVTVRGRVVVDAAATPSVTPTEVVVALTPPDDLQHLQARLGFAVLSRRLLRAVPDLTGAFAFQPVVPSRFRVEVPVSGAAGGARWFLKSATLGGRDVTDVEFDVEPDRTVSDLVVTVTSLTQRLTGTFVDASGRVPTSVGLVAFPVDRRFWLPGSRRVRMASRATDGSFEIPDLPAGDYYLAAFTGGEPDELGDSGFLDPLVAGALPLSLAPGEHKVQHLYGELLVGDAGGRTRLLADYALMHQAPRVTHAEVVEFVRHHRLQGKGIDWIDVHLLASALVGGSRLWTKTCWSARAHGFPGDLRHRSLSQHFVRPHHVVVFVLEDVAVEDVLLRPDRPWRQLEKRANPRHDSRVRRHGVLEALVVGLTRQCVARVEGRRVRVRLSSRTRLLERFQVGGDVDWATAQDLELRQVQMHRVRIS